MSTQSIAGTDVSGRDIVYGTWTSESTKENHIITVPFPVSYVKVWLDIEGVNVDELEQHLAATTQTNLITGADGISTTPLHAAGIDITNNSDGTATVDIDETSQTDSGVNAFMMIRKA